MLRTRDASEKRGKREEMIPTRRSSRRCHRRPERRTVGLVRAGPGPVGEPTLRCSDLRSGGRRPLLGKDRIRNRRIRRDRAHAEAARASTCLRVRGRFGDRQGAPLPVDASKGWHPWVGLSTRASCGDDEPWTPACAMVCGVLAFLRPSTPLMLRSSRPSTMLRLRRLSLSRPKRPLSVDASEGWHPWVGLSTGAHGGEEALWTPAFAGVCGDFAFFGPARPSC